MHRFFQYAMVAVALLVVVGTLLLALALGQLDLLWTSAYGQLFTVKLILVAALLTLAAINKRWLTPVLLNGGQAAVVALWRSITAEIVTAVRVLLATAGFTTLVGTVG